LKNPFLVLDFLDLSRQLVTFFEAGAYLVVVPYMSFASLVQNDNSGWIA
jgi:hypothetical protein